MTTAIVWAVSLVAAAGAAWWLGARHSRARTARAVGVVADRIRGGVGAAADALRDPAFPELGALREALAAGYVVRGSERLETAAAAVSRISDYADEMAARPLRAAIAEAPPRVRAAIQEALEAVEGLRTHRLSADLSPEMENLTQALQEVIDEFAADSRSIVKLVAPERPVRAPLAKEAFKDALYLVLLNAEQFSGSRPVDVRLLDEGSVARVLVRDRGPGFRGEALERGFEPFYTTEKAALGLGLTHARQVVLAHRGQMRVRNREEGGAEAELVIPTAPQHPNPVQ